MLLDESNACKHLRGRNRENGALLLTCQSYALSQRFLPRAARPAIR